MTDRQLSLELELQATKNTVVKLTSRVQSLECEFARLKSLLRRSILMPTDQRTSPAPQSGTSSESNPVVIEEVEFEPNSNGLVTEVISISDSSDEETESHKQVKVAGAKLPEPDVRQNMEEDEQETNVTTQEESENQPSCSKTNSVASVDKEIRIKSQRNLFITADIDGPTSAAVWNHFEQTDLVNEGETMVMLCKQCQSEVPGRIDLLRRHLGNCSVRNTSPLTTNQPKSKKSTRSHSAAAEKSKSILKGRRKHQVWRGFDTIVKDNYKGIPSKKINNTHLIAICKRCNERVIAKAERLKHHSRRCSKIRKKRAS